LRREAQVPSAIAPFTGWRQAPDRLSERGKEIWCQTIDLIPGLVLPLDSFPIERFCYWRELLESMERETADSRDDDRRRVLQAVVELCRRHVLEGAEQLGLTLESHLLATRYLETPEGRAAHQELKSIFEKPRRSRPMGGRRKPPE
jgi:hypothetical protein